MHATPARAVALAVHGYQLDDLLIDTGSRRVTRDGVDLRIAGLSFDLLIALVRAAPSLVSLDVLMDTVWSGVVVSPETVTQRVKLLRQALGDSADAPRYIGGVRGHGYRVLSAATPLETEVQPASRAATRRTARCLPAAVALAVPLGLGAWWLAERPAAIPALSTSSATGTAGSASTAGTPATRDVEANRLYLQARAIGRGTPQSERESQSLLDEALARDPNFAPALAYRAQSVAGAAALGYDVPPSKLAEAEQDALRALALSPGSADAHASVGLISAVRGNWIDAARNYRAALAADPDNLVSRDMYTLVVQRPTGHVRRALELLNESYALAPTDGFTIHELALTNSLLGHDADAIKFVRLHDELGGGGQNMGNALVSARAAARSGRYREAAERVASALPAAVASANGNSLAETFYGALADPARAAEARRAFESVVPKLASSEIDGQVRGFFIQALTALGALDAAYELATRSTDDGIQAGMVGSRFYLADLWLPEMRPFRRDPRFQALVERLKLTDYWAVYGPPDGCDLDDHKVVCR